MDIGSLLIVIALFILVVSYLASPFASQDIKELSDYERTGYLLESQRKAVLQSITELEFDLEIKKVTEDVHKIEREKLLSQAEKIYHELDLLLSNELSVSTDDELEKQIEKYKESKALNLFCSNCGESIIKKDKFCGECGEEIQ